MTSDRSWISKKSRGFPLPLPWSLAKHFHVLLPSRKISTWTGASSVSRRRRSCDGGGLGAVHQCVCAQGRVESFPRAFDAGDWKLAGIQQAELDQHGSLVPIDMFVGQLAFSETNDGRERDLNPLSRRRDPRQHPVHADGVRELEDHFIDQLIRADGP